MTNKELLRELKINNLLLKIIKITGTVSITGAITCDYELVKKVYFEYMNQTDLFDSTSYLYLGLITVCLSEYIVGKMLYENIIDENIEIYQTLNN